LNRSPAHDTAGISRRQAWMLASRPKTLPAAVAPVAVGIAAAVRDGVFAPLPALAALAGALLLQIGVNLANDYFDFKKGVDTAGRKGPLRVTQAGLISPEDVRLGMVLVFFLAAVVGVYLAAVGGWPILAVGTASILAALAYSGGPRPIASHGLGDVFVFVFFGLAAVCGTYYVQALRLTPFAVAASLPPGLLITAILVVNNLRDIETDAKVGKRTLAVRLGPRGTLAEYAALMAGAYLLLPMLWLSGWADGWVILPFLTLPMTVPLLRTLAKEYRDGPAMNRALAGTARYTLVFCLLFAIGIVS
jgi:1,4-dihydroxy-2-naphthoate octaprenyltransferase